MTGDVVYRWSFAAVVALTVALAGCASDGDAVETTTTTGTASSQPSSTTVPTVPPWEDANVPEPLSSIPPIVPQASHPADAFPSELAGVVDAAIVDLADRLDVDSVSVAVIVVEEVVWPDASLGCPQPDMMYAQVLTDGTRVLLEVDGIGYSYHTDGLIDPFLCAAAPLDKLVADRLELIDPGVKDEMFPTREPGGPGGEPDV